MPNAGGSVNYVYRLLNGIKDYSIVVYTSSFGNDLNADFDKTFNGKIIRSKYCQHVLEYFKGGGLKKRLYDLIAIFQVLNLMIKYRPRLVYFTEYSFIPLAYVIASWFYKFRFGIFTYAEELLQDRDRPVHGRVIKKLLMDADIIITVCNYTRNLINNIANVDNKIHVIIPSVPQTNPSNTLLYYNKQKNMDEIRILTVARLEERKGHIDVLEALARLVVKYPNIKYDIVGNGCYENKIREKIKMLNLESTVSLLGRLSDEDLEKEYCRAHIFAMPHKQLENGDTEGCPTVFLEAGLHFLPVVGGEAGGVGDAIKHGVTGFICKKKTDDVYNYLETLILSPHKREEMGKAGYEYAIKFTTDKQSMLFKKITDTYYHAE